MQGKLQADSGPTLHCSARFPMTNPKVLVVGDENLSRMEICAVLKGRGYEVTAATGDYVTRCLADLQADVVVTEIVMQEQEGLELIARVCNLRRDLTTVAIAGGERAATYLKLARLFGAAATLLRPFSADEILEVVAWSVAQKQIAGSSSGPSDRFRYPKL